MDEYLPAPPVVPSTTSVRAHDELRALLRGNPRMLGPLTRKAREGLAARYYLRKCTRVGRYVRVEGRVIVENRGEISIGARVKIRSTIVRCELIAYPGGRLEIGDGTYINYGSSIAAHELIQIGSDCLFGPYTNIIDNNYHDIQDRVRRPPSRPVIIGDRVWVGARAIILPGVTIGESAVIAAGAVVREDVPPRTIVAGNPARVVVTF